MNNNETITNFLPETFVEGFHDAETVKKMKYRKFGNCVDKNGNQMHVSILSLGTSSFGAAFREANDEESIQIVIAAVRAGINLIDCAAWYGHGRSEKVLGQALKHIPREAYYVQTKCGRYEPDLLNMFDFSQGKTKISIDTSLERLGCGYLDCILVHDPEYGPLEDIVNETLPEMNKAKSEGKARMIGITGFPLSIHKELVQNSTVPIDVALSYCHYSLNDTSLVDGLLPFFQEHNIACINAAPISMGLLSTRGPPSWHPATAEIKDVCKQASDYCGERQVNISKLAMHFSLEEESIPTTLVSTASISRFQENLSAVYELGSLSEAEAKALDYIRTNFFKPLKNKSWEGIEVELYKEKIEKAKRGESVGTLSTM